MTQRIQLARPWFDEHELEAVRRVLDSGWIVQGSEVEAFERDIASLHQARHCVVVSSGTAALHIAYLALDIGAGDAIFIPSFAWPSAANVAKLQRAEPVFIDVLPGTYNVDPEDLARRVERCVKKGTSKPRAIVAVHEFGLAADLDKIHAIASQYRLRVIEDAACALGATYRGKPVGTFGELGIFSFHPRKSVTTGEGGAIVTNDDELAERCRSWRNHGQRVVAGHREFILPGLNYRLTELQAAIGRVQMGKFPGILSKRRSMAAQYLQALKSCKGLKLPVQSSEHTWQTFMVLLADGVDRAALIQRLAEDGIETGPGSIAAHLGSHFQPQLPLPVSERLHHSGLALPLHAGLDEQHVASVARSLCRCLESLCS